MRKFTFGLIVAVVISLSLSLFPVKAAEPPAWYAVSVEDTTGTQSTTTIRPQLALCDGQLLTASEEGTLIRTSAPPLFSTLRLSVPFCANDYWDPGQGDAFYIGQRSGSRCAEHDSYVVPIAMAVRGRYLREGTGISAHYRIGATHPLTEVHPLGEPSYRWCEADWTDCPGVFSEQDNGVTYEAISPILSMDDIIKVFDNVEEQVYVLDGAPDIGTFEVVVNGQLVGQHSGVIFGSRWGSANSWNHDGVIYANGFSRWKPKGEEPGYATDPCFGTSVILGPFQMAEPFLSDGYSPNPLRHPTVDAITITVGSGWIAEMSGGFIDESSRVIDASWSIRRLSINSAEMLVSVSQYVTATHDVLLEETQGVYGIGLVGMSSMFANAQKHDADTQIGPTSEVWVGDISDSNEGLWGQEYLFHYLLEGTSLCLDTSTPTTHNTGSPALCILWDRSLIQ